MHNAPNANQCSQPSGDFYSFAHLRPLFLRALAELRGRTIKHFVVVDSSDLEPTQSSIQLLRRFGLNSKCLRRRTCATNEAGDDLCFECVRVQRSISSSDLSDNWTHASKPLRPNLQLESKLPMHWPQLIAAQIRSLFGSPFLFCSFLFYLLPFILRFALATDFAAAVAVAVERFVWLSFVSFDAHFICVTRRQ